MYIFFILFEIFLSGLRYIHLKSKDPNKELKLNIGCGTATSENWINIDKSLNIYLSKFSRLKKLMFRLRIISKEVYEARWSGTYLRRDVTRGLPFESNTIDFIYSSHLLEHMINPKALHFLEECYRVLKVGGILRIVVPDLKTMALKYISVSDDNTIERGIAADLFLTRLGFFFKEDRTFIERAIGKQNLHHWMYDTDSLSKRLEIVGFSKIECSTFGKGGLPDLEKIEKRDDGSIFLEAMK